MKRLYLLLLLALAFFQAHADHLKGGFFTYRYIGQGTNDPSKNMYDVTLTVYMVCDATTNQRPPSVPITIFDAGSGAQVRTLNAPLTETRFLEKTRDEECITNQPPRCYYLIQVYRLSELELDPNSAGYILSYQRCCRIIGITNIFGTSNAIGNTYSIAIPGTAVHPDDPKNNSSTFLTNDTVVICRNNYFEYSFKGNDPDGDSLVYSFCDAWEGGGLGNGLCYTCVTPNPAAPPPYNPIPYSTGFSGGTPLGDGVTINATTGLMSGIAPDVGEYVVTVCVEEWRNGRIIARNRKELHIKVADCSSVRATLNPSYVNCKDFNVLFFNNTPTGVNTSFWDFGVPGLTNDTSNLPTVQYSYPDTGVYIVKLVVNRGERCADSAVSTVRVFPGFFPNFGWKGICAAKPTVFSDSSVTRYGTVNLWRWDFGDPAVTNDTSRLQNPVYTYRTPATYNVQFVVGTSKGCRDTITKQITIVDKPPIAFPFRDTLICKGDTLQLSATGSGEFSWTPNTQMLNGNTPNPLVWPELTTWYTAHLDDNGCLNRDSLKVRVVNFVTLQMNPDTSVCLADSVQLGARTDGLRFLWTPNTGMNDPTLLRPTVLPALGLNTYNLTAYIGHCSASLDQRVRAVPYPLVSISGDTTICFRASAQLQGSSNGTTFSWTPDNWLTNANTLTPTARPPATITYVLTVRDTLSGCPKPSRDSVVVNVMPRIFPRAGNDTMVIAGQPVQLHASGGIRYEWEPTTGLNRPDTSDPTGLYDVNPEYIRYIVRVYDSLNCVDSARLTVRIFRTEPSIFVPTAFTPNGDGRNDVVKPIAVGMREIEYFRIYNRWGELVFETTVNGAGWDGRINGKDQGTNVFVWVVKAIDFTGKPYFAKGTVTLIR